MRLSQVAGRKVKTFSTGMRQRLLLARALLNSPRVLFLDEPTRGLDPRSARDLREIVRSLAEGGSTIFLTTHDMHEADELCARVAFLADGKVVALDTPRALKLSLRDEAPEVDVVLDDGSDQRLKLGDERDARAAAGAHRRGRVRSLHSLEPTLADVFINLAGRSLEDDTTRSTEREPAPDPRDPHQGPEGRRPRRADHRPAALPIGMAMFYNATIDDEDKLPQTKVAVVESGDRVATQLREAAGKSVEVSAQGDSPSRRASSSPRRTSRWRSSSRNTASDDPARALVLVGAEATPTAQSVVALVPDALTRAPAASRRRRRRSAPSRRPIRSRTSSSGSAR